MNGLRCGFFMLLASLLVLEWPVLAAPRAVPSVRIAGSWKTLSRTQISAWARSAAEQVKRYYGRFPAPEAEISIQAEEGSSAIHARTFGGRFIRVSLGEEASARDLRRDWVMVHEMVHLSFPELGDDYAWMEEGLATWLEPIIRARAGVLPEDEFWEGVVQGMPHGEPQPGDRGLDRTHTWGRTYWGGALYWLTCDLEIREATGNGKSLDDVLRAILDQGGDGAHTWTLEKVFATAKQATGLDSLRTLHARYGLRSEGVDLDALWKRLGIVAAGRRLRFDDGAPLASIRRSITRVSAAATLR